MTEFTIYANGLCYSSVCSSLPQEEVKRRMAEELTGVTHPWTLSHKPFRTGETNPCPGDMNPRTHKHYLFEC